MFKIKRERKSHATIFYEANHGLTIFYWKDTTTFYCHEISDEENEKLTLPKSKAAA